MYSHFPQKSPCIVQRTLHSTYSANGIPVAPENINFKSNKRAPHMHLFFSNVILHKLRRLFQISPLRTSSSSQIKPKPLHTTPVLAHQIPTSLLRVLGGGEEHAFVAGGFLFFAYAAGLLCIPQSAIALLLRSQVVPATLSMLNLDLSDWGVRLTFTLVAPSVPGGLVSEARLLICEALPVGGRC